MTVAAVLLSADTPATPSLVGGLPLLTRHMLELHRLGITDFYLVGVPEVPQAAGHRRIPAAVKVHTIPRWPECGIPQEIRALLAMDHSVLVLRSQWLIDPRLFADLLSASSARCLLSPGGANEAIPVAALLTAQQQATWERGDIEQCMRSSPPLDLTQLDSYSPANRGPIPFYLRPVVTQGDAVTATKLLITAASKHTLDIVASLLDKLLVNRLVFWLCSTRMTPNQVTLGTAVIGVLVAWLFFHDWWRLGSLLVYAAVTLDGVDGKLARTTLLTSRLGELEHVLDFFMEQAWYLTITLSLLHKSGNQALWWVGGGLMACDLLVKVLYGVGQRLFGKHLEELGAFDRWFRRLGGRRNLYMGILCIGFWTGIPQQALAVTFGYALVTLIVHTTQIAYHTRQRPAVALHSEGVPKTVV